MQPGSPKTAALVWFRRDLRLADHAALAAARACGLPVIPVFILDDETPGAWRMGGASRWWLAGSLRSLDKGLGKLGSRLILRRGPAERVLTALIAETGATKLFFTRAYDPFQRALEDRLKVALGGAIELKRFGGQILCEPEQILNASGEPFRVYSAFYRALVRRDRPARPLPAPLALHPPAAWPQSERLDDWELEPSKPNWAKGFPSAWTPGEPSGYARLRLFLDKIVTTYKENRNNPGSDATSRLSPYLAFGEISPRQIWNAVLTAAEAASQPELGEAYLREIAWREFSYHLLFHFPALPDKALRPEFATFPFREDARALEAWQKGLTGYPIVDAGMRQLWRTGWMHNRVRMIAASFLIKHLLQPWQAGEAWFWDTLVDADLANNAASWQWVAGSGADAAPYFRIFNPVLQGEKFDPAGDYVRAFCPELAGLPASLIHKPWEGSAASLARHGVVLGVTYPQPVITHAEGRARALAAFASLKDKSDHG